MSYLVLARKWRPKRFAELVGQEHVVRALSNALDTGRVHHAFLFSGTRGVGKTTIARIFAKSLNCERGTSAEPCGECNSCKDIDAGRFIDLLEIDAASNTGVDDVRDLIDNAQYMPSRGRVKVYLIDEVHMLSKSAFNALLKTLEEPPGHVKFLLATTDPQKLPVTVLSRCLQFNLKRLDEGQISGQIDKILAAEGIAVEPGAVRQISKAADGSLRDGLSLLDQAIAYTGGQLTDAAVATMLGTVDQTRVGALLAALADGDGDRLLAEVTTLAEFSPDWASVLEALAEAMHRIQVRQLVPGAAVEADGVDIDGLADAVPAELVQLWYQMAINGRRDLALAPSPRAGFEMSVLRMLAFRPAGPDTARAASAVPARSKPGPTVELPAGNANAKSSASANPLMQDDPMRADPATGPLVASSPGSITGPASAPVDTATPASSTGSGLDPESTAEARQQIDAQPEAAYPAQVRREEQLHAGERAISEPAAMSANAATGPDTGPRSAPPASAGATLDDAAAWHAWVMASSLKGPARVLAEHVGFIDCNNGVLSLALAPVDELLNKPALVRQIAEALASTLGDVPEIRFQASTGEDGPVSLNERNERARDERQTAAEHAFMNDIQVQALISQHGARLVPDSIRPIDDA